MHLIQISSRGRTLESLQRSATSACATADSTHGQRVESDVDTVSVEAFKGGLCGRCFPAWNRHWDRAQGGCFRHVDMEKKKQKQTLQRKTMPSALQSDGIVSVFSIRLEGADTCILYRNKDWFSPDMCLFLQLSRKISLCQQRQTLTVGSYLPPQGLRTSYSRGIVTFNPVQLSWPLLTRVCLPE